MKKTKDCTVAMDIDSDDGDDGDVQKTKCMKITLHDAKQEYGEERPR